MRTASHVDTYAHTVVLDRRGVVDAGVLAPRFPLASCGGSYPGKRLLDVFLATIALAVLLPLLLLIAALVFVADGGPVFFWSQRVGRNGRIFWMPKFRTMSHGAPVAPREKLSGAERHITAVGHWLRRSGVDELPQLLCIVRGDMSIIGPRPLLPNDPAVAARAEFPKSTSPRPGVSGLAQVMGRNSVAPRRKARLDAFYADAASLRLDAVIFCRTVETVFTSRGFM